MKVDIEEAKFQAEERRKAIEKAKTLLYHQTDRVKKFHVRKQQGGGSGRVDQRAMPGLCQCVCTY